MELSQRDRLSELVEGLTTAGEPQLNQQKMKELKKICKVSNDFIDHVYHLIMSQLNEDHAEIRLSAFQIASELFSRSHHFRTLVVDNFQDLLDLTVETDTELPLPPPKPVAKKLRSLAIQTVQSWQASYGSAYKKLALGYHFLKQVKKVDFNDVEARTIAERRREEERQRKMERIYKERVEAATKEMEESHEEIQVTLTEMDSCMELLLPDFVTRDFETSEDPPKGQTQVELEEEGPCCSKDLRTDTEGGEVKEKEVDTDINAEVAGQDEDTDEETNGEGEESGAEVEVEDSFLRNSGFISHLYSLDLKLNPGIQVHENDDNEAVVSTVIDLHRLINNKHLPAVQNWVQVFTKSGADQQLLRRALDLKKSLEVALQKHKELHIDYRTRIRKVITASSDDEDDEFDEVPEKEGYEPHIPDHLRAEYGLEPSPSTSKAPVVRKTPVNVPTKPTEPQPSSSRKMKRQREEEEDPTCAAATIKLLKKNIRLPAQPSSSGPSPKHSDPTQKVTKAPVVPFGLDLYYWGEELPNAGKIIKSSSQHQFWVPAEVVEEVDNPELEAESRSRYITFPGKFSPVSHYCRAPLGEGRLCQRQDRVKCPFHGRIVPRDQDGRPCTQEDRRREEQEERRRREEQPDWRDAELMRDIEAATGEDLGSDRIGKKGKGKGKKKKYPNLSDLKQSANTTRSRLEKRVFNKSSMRRVAQVLSKADSRKHDKFSNQFNYALN